MNNQFGFDEIVCTPQALKGCLDYLYRQAMIAGLRLPAHFIGAAAAATSEIIERDGAARDARPTYDAGEPLRANGSR